MSAVPEITKELWDRLFRFIHARVKDASLAQDLTQDILLKASVSLVTDVVKNVDGLLFRIARNAVADHFRRGSAPLQLSDRSYYRAADHDLVKREEDELRRELAAYVSGVVDQLPEPYREAFQLAEYEHLMHQTIAERLGISLTCAKSRVRRARSMVRRIVERCCRINTDAYGQVIDCTPRIPADCAC